MRQPPVGLLFSLAMGLAYGLAVKHGLPQFAWNPAPAPVLRVTLQSLEAPQPPKPLAAREQLPIETSAPAPVVRPQSPDPARTSERSQATPASRQVRKTQPEPPIGEPAVSPEAPPDDAPALTYHDAPGGDVLVLGLLIDHTGRILQTQVLVASRHTMEDLTFALTMRGQYFSRVAPPLAIGQTRWVQARIPYAPTTDSLLP